MFSEDLVSRWIADDPDPATARELSDLLATTKKTGPDAEAARAELTDRFSGMLQFGTAGLRGRLGGGPNRMNRAVVMRAAAGLTGYLADRVGEGFVVAIGYDARYGSKQFATDTAAIVTAAGGVAHLMPRELPTPLLAFAVRDLDADAGVMVTASHNPPQDNGYKVYVGRSQIVPPTDAQIAAQIEAVAAAPLSDIPRVTDYETVGEALIDAYGNCIIESGQAAA